MKPHKHRRGAVIVWIAIILTVLIAFCGLACDTAFVSLTRGQLQLVADASALAAAQALRTTTDGPTVAAAANGVAALNKVAGQPITLSATTNDIVLGYYDLADGFSTTPTSTQTTLNAVKVYARRTKASPNGALPLMFGSFFGVTTSDLTCTAVATFTMNPSPGLLLLGTSGPSLWQGTTSCQIVVNGGSIAVNSSYAQAVNLSPQATVVATSLNIVGGYAPTGASLPTVTLTGQAPAPDPYSSYSNNPLTPPLNAKPYTPASGSIPDTYHPGTYQTDLTINRDSAFDAGEYYFNGPNGLMITGTPTIKGNNLLFYFNNGSLRINGSPSINLTPETAGYCPGVTVFQPSTNPTGPFISGAATVNLNGVLYIPAGTLALAGSAQTFGAALIVKTLMISDTPPGLIQINTVQTTSSSTKPPNLVQ